MYRLTVVIFAVSTASVAFLNLAESAGICLFISITVDLLQGPTGEIPHREHLSHWKAIFSKQLYFSRHKDLTSIGAKRSEAIFLTI